MDMEILCYGAQTGAGNSDVDREVGGNRTEPKIQLGSDNGREKKSRLDGKA